MAVRNGIEFTLEIGNCAGGAKWNGNWMIFVYVLMITCLSLYTTNVDALIDDVSCGGRRDELVPGELEKQEGRETV